MNLLDANKRLAGLRRRQLLALPALAWPAQNVMSAAEPSADELDQALKALVEHEQRPLASLSVLVQREGRNVYEAQFGRRYIAPPGGVDLPVTADTLFRMASVTKLVVAVAAWRLVDAGRLDLDADIGKILGYELRHPRYSRTPLTARLLLTHRSGLTDGGDDYLDPHIGLRELLLPGGRSFGKGGSWGAHVPGRFFQYANLNFAVLASVMERAAGQRFDELMQHWVLMPLGMQGGFDAARLPPSQLNQVATLYRKARADGGRWDPAGPWHAQTDDFKAVPPQPIGGAALASYMLGSNGALFGPQGRLRTRVSDLGRLMAMLVDEGRYQGEPFLRPASARALLSEEWRFDAAAANGDTADGAFQAWGVGAQHFIDRSRPQWGDRLLPQGGVEAWGHLGFAYGLQSGVIFDPRRRCGVIYAIGGCGANPAVNPGRYSSFALWEEQLLGLLWARALG
ncbi:serine hydrolase domain-containing protein [Paucibacter sp. JuS9]|uniref:serine hydrolase domain-containing protein n=1 Tax=Paucibacter sp. JuS9 TaxID=3228748 RepID=UPI003757BA8A